MSRVREKRVDLEYPGTPDAKYTHLTLGLLDVRAADDIRVSYDYDRDGWKIEQAKFFEWDTSSECPRGWTEVAFVKAWALEETHPSVEEPDDQAQR